MKNKFYILFPLVIACLWISSCSLDYDPVSFYSDVTEGVDTTDVKPIFVNRAAAVNERIAVMRRYGDGQEHWHLDILLLNEVHADNAYYGTYGNETTPFAENSIEGSNINLRRDWNQHMGNVARANRFIWGVDALNDMTAAEKQQFIAEGKIFRAMIYFDMVRIWGRVPLITNVAGEITSENVAEMYPVYFPSQTDELEVYQQIEQDLLDGLAGALNVVHSTPESKTWLSKSVARALLAKLYAEKPLRDYNKVIKYADELTADGFQYEEDFENLWAVILERTDTLVGLTNRAINAHRNSIETVYEAQFVTGRTSWLAMMYGRILNNWNSNFTWAKWITPSRNLINEYHSEGVVDKRYASTVAWYSCGWSVHYPMDNYAFMFKYRCNQSSMIKIRYADIQLLKAEALISKGDFSGAATIINKTRQRAGLQPLPASASANRDAIMNAYMKERRLELAFEGERWFDLVRLDKVEEVMNTAIDRDPDRIPLVYKFDEYSYKLPIPADVLYQNPNLVQNPGY